jgi:hypothetical protein
MAFVFVSLFLTSHTSTAQRFRDMAPVGHSLFTTVVSVDGLLFALYYALTGIATAVYYRKLATRGA